MYTLLDELHLAYLPIDADQVATSPLPQPPSHWIWTGQPKHQLEFHDLGWGSLWTTLLGVAIIVTAFKGLHPIRSYLLHLGQSLPLLGSAYAPHWYRQWRYRSVYYGICQKGLWILNSSKAYFYPIAHITDVRLISNAAGWDSIKVYHSPCSERQDWRGRSATSLVLPQLQDSRHVWELLTHLCLNA